ncbi:MAG: hypothetical protein Q9220_005063 [cf. Caloplaca sp. 1 TL-2023]
MADIPNSNPQYPEPLALPQRGRSRSPTTLGGPSWTSFKGAPVDPIYNGTSYTKRSIGAPLSTRSSVSGARRGSNTHFHELDRRNSPSNRSSPTQQWPGHEIRHDHPQGQPLHDPEKANPPQISALSGRHTSHTHSTYISEEEEDQKQHTVWILIYLSFLSPIAAILVSFYTIAATLILLMLSPVTICCRTCTPLKSQLRRFLSPPIRFQLRLVFSECDSEFEEVTIKAEQDGEYQNNPFMLILINILSPVYAGGIAITAWVAAGFWLTAFILGNPDGRDGKDDGRTVVLGVRRLWERWLLSGLR